MSKSSKLYSKSPTLKRGEDGDVGIQRPTDADMENAGLADGAPAPGMNSEVPVDVNQANERTDVHHRQIKEHMDMHRRHEVEHSAHKSEDKKELHKKHEEEHKHMIEKHHEELKAMHKRHGKSSGTKEKE